MIYHRVSIGADERVHLVLGDGAGFNEERKSACGKKPFPERWATDTAPASCPACVYQALKGRRKR